MDLSAVNAIGLTNYVNKPVLKVKDMQINVEYPLLNIKAVHTTFGRSILVETSNNVIFLPKRVAEELDDEKLIEMGTMQLALIHRGMAASGKANPAALIEFVVKQ